MIYALNDLLQKMGAPEVREKGRIEWHYFDKIRNALGGFAEIRLEAGGERMIAEMKSIRENHTDDEGRLHPVYTESFYLYAERTARAGHYRINKIVLDGDEYNNPQKGVIELGLSVFHARALDISIRMVEQVFNKQDIVEPASDPLANSLAALPPALLPRLRDMPATEPARESFGVVIPFRPRSELRARV